MKNNNKIFYVLFLSFVLSCNTQTTSISHHIVVNNTINLGQSFYGWKDEYGYILNPYNNPIKKIDVICDGVEYTLGISNDQKIEYISTNDKSFSINGYKVGDEIFKTKTIPGWGNYTKMNEEWYAAWMPMKNQVNEKKGKIQWFFKFDFD